jgi:hypothetical protein
VKRGILLLKEEHKLQMCENEVLKRTSEPKMDVENGKFGIFHNKKLCD